MRYILISFILFFAGTAFAGDLGIADVTKADVERFTCGRSGLRRYVGLQKGNRSTRFSSSVADWLLMARPRFIFLLYLMFLSAGVVMILDRSVIGFGVEDMTRR